MGRAEVDEEPGTGVVAVPEAFVSDEVDDFGLPPKAAGVVVTGIARLCVDGADAGAEETPPPRATPRKPPRPARAAGVEAPRPLEDRSPPRPVRREPSGSTPPAPAMGGATCVCEWVGRDCVVVDPGTDVVIATPAVASGTAPEAVPGVVVAEADVSVVVVDAAAGPDPLAAVFGCASDDDTEGVAAAAAAAASFRCVFLDLTDENCSAWPSLMRPTATSTMPLLSEITNSKSSSVQDGKSSESIASCVGYLARSARTSSVSSSAFAAAAVR